MWSILDALAATGIDGWHGIRPNIGMDLRRLKACYGRRLCFFGGLVIAAGNVPQPGATLENYPAARQATRDLGAYPIRGTA